MTNWYLNLSKHNRRVWGFTVSAALIDLLFVATLLVS